MDIGPEQPEQALIDNRKQIFERQRQQILRRTDRMFAVLMVLQWLGGIVAACILTPRTWHGSQSEIHPHVWLAVGLGGVLAFFPVCLAWRFPGRRLTRHVIAVTQMLFSALLIHISGGRIETHFHVFGSLAFLAFYRDWQVLIPATVVVAADHFIRGVYWPESVFGIATASPYRWIEHAAWVVFEDVFLIISCRQGVKEMWSNAMRTAELERLNADLSDRTAQLEHACNSKNAMVETALDAVISADMHGRITGWNTRAEQTFGWTAQEAIGRPLAGTVIPPRFCERYEEGLRNFRESGTTNVFDQRIETTAIHQSGREFPVELAIAPIGAGENVTFCAFVRDITERRQAAEALHRTKDAAEAANQAKSAFLAHMSHEIRTPLNGILGFADILLKTGPEASEAERRDYLETINYSGRHLLGLINDVLDLTKVESGQMEVELVRSNPHQIIAEATSILRVRAQQKGIRLEYDWQGLVPETILTDPSRFRQLLMNLVGNAIKFTEQGGVTVVARLDQQAQCPRLTVDVVDTGIGIAPESLERIFEPFTQADQSITRRFGGTGLGLAISRQIAELLGGELTVRSEEGRGSTFTVTIAVGDLSHVRLFREPQADVMPQADPETTFARHSLSAASILLVEDGETNRKLISLILRRAGLRVAMAENGQIGLEMMRHNQYDLVLMDMQMPVVDGYTASGELRRRGVTIPIIALTAHSMKGDEERCRTAGCSGYLTKPIESDRLLSAVADALRGSPSNLCDSEAASECGERMASTLPTDDPDFCELIIEFLDQLQEKLEEMRSLADAQGDYSEIAHRAHWLKGAGGTAGFAVLTAPAAALESAAKANDPAAVSASLEQLVQLSARLDRPTLPAEIY